MTSRRSRHKDKKRNDRRRDEARAASEAGDLERAQRILLELVGRAPGNARYLVDLARVELARGRASAAERALRRALALSPNYAEARALLGDEPPAPAVAQGAEERPGARELGEALRALPWPRLARELTERGLVLLPDLFDPEASAEQHNEVAAGLALAAEAVAAAWQAVLGTARELELDRLEPRPAPAPRLKIRALLATAAGGARSLEQRDLRSGRERRRALVVRPGGAALYCAASRPVRVGGVWGLQAVEVVERSLPAGE